MLASIMVCRISNKSLIVSSHKFAALPSLRWRDTMFLSHGNNRKRPRSAQKLKWVSKPRSLTLKKHAPMLLIIGLPVEPANPTTYRYTGRGKVSKVNFYLASQYVI